MSISKFQKTKLDEFVRGIAAIADIARNYDETQCGISNEVVGILNRDELAYTTSELAKLGISLNVENSEIHLTSPVQNGIISA